MSGWGSLLTQTNTCCTVSQRGGSQQGELVAHSKVKGRLVVPVHLVCAQNPLDSAVDLLPVGRTGPTGVAAKVKDIKSY